MAPFPIIDAHQHFWQFQPERDTWISADMKVLQQDYLPPRLQQVYDRLGIQASVLVQSAESEAHNLELLQYADEHPFVQGVVGWIQLPEEGKIEWNDWHRHPKLKGFRHVWQSHPQRNAFLVPQVVAGLQQLGQAGFTYDLLVMPDQLGFVDDLLRQLPDQKMVLDHGGKPPIASRQLADWAGHVRRLGQHPHLHCKLSGLVTEAAWQGWHPQEIYQCFDVLVEAFGPQRLLFGTDWPVCLLAASLEQVVSMTLDYFEPFSLAEREAIFGRNAQTFYQLI